MVVARKQYKLLINNKEITHEGIKTPWDSVYFSVLDSEKPGISRKFKTFECGWNYGEAKPHHYTSFRHLRFNLIDLSTNQEVSIPIYRRYIRRKNQLGESYKVAIFKVSAFALKQKLGNDTYNRFLKEVNQVKNQYKKEHNRSLAAKRKSDMEKVLKECGITEKEYYKEKRLKKQKRKQQLSAENSIERTKRILNVAPALSELKDEIEVVLRQFNDGRGRLAHAHAKIKKLKTALKTVRSLKTK